MFSTYQDALEWIHNRLKFGIKPGLERMEWLLEKLDHPERRIKTIHIAGTNGKGSTVTYLRTILTEAGYEVGTFTSPYIENFNERISVNGHPISNEELLELVNKIKPLVEELENTNLGSPTEFEVITVMMLLYFGTVAYPDLCVIETGLGGRLDSTNIIVPLISIITSIGFDHMAILGETLQQITYEKAGIIKAGVPVISGVDQDEAQSVIEKKAKDVQAKVYQYQRDFTVFNKECTGGKEIFSFSSVFKKRERLALQMLGEHQIDNAALSLMAIDYLRTYYSLIVEDEHVYEGLRKAVLMGRFEQVSKDPLIYIDGAHNPQGMEKLVSTLQRHLPNKHIRFIYAALSDKKTDDILSQMKEVAFRITFTSFDFPKACSAHELFEQSRFTNKHCLEDWQDALKREIEQMGDNEALIITGSLYFISEVRKYFK